MNFRKKGNENIQIVNKADVLTGLQICCVYFERNSKKDALFQPEYEVSKTINSILEQRKMLTESDVIDVVNLFNDIDKVEHYDGSGWLDYQMRLAYFFKLSGFKIEIKEKKLYLI